MTYDWPPRVDLGHRVLPCPVHALPWWLADWAAAKAVSAQVPVDMPAMLGLAVASGALARRVACRAKADWLEPANLWVLVVAPPSTRKSPVYAAALAPIEEYEAEQAALEAPEIQAALDRQEILEEQIKRTKGQCARCQPGEKHALLLELEDYRRQLVELVLPTPTRLLASDTTTEAVIQLLGSCGGRLIVASDEGGFLATVGGRYASGVPNLDAILQGYSGGTIRVDRRSRGPEHVTEAALTLVLTIQDRVLREVHGSEAMSGRGVLARPMIIIPYCAIGQRESALATPAVPDDVAAAYRDGLRRLLLAPHNGHARELRVADDARELMTEYDREVERELAPEGGLGLVAEWAAKQTGRVLRLACVLACCDDPGAWCVTRDVAERAVELGRYAASHAVEAERRVSDGRDPQALEDARRIAEVMARLGEAEYPYRVLQQRVKHLMGASRYVEGLAELVRRGWIHWAIDEKPDRIVTPRPEGV